MTNESLNLLPKENLGVAAAALRTRTENRPVTLVEVGKRVGVSAATVSRVLSGFPRIHINTRQRVLDAVREMGYRPNPMAQQLALGRRRHQVTAKTGTEGI